jgi:hypothetical protein
MMDQALKSNKYTNTSLLLTTVGTLLSIQKPVLYLDLIILAVGFSFGVIGYYKSKP